MAEATDDAPMVIEITYESGAKVQFECESITVKRNTMTDKVSGIDVEWRPGQEGKRWLFLRLEHIDCVMRVQ